MDNPMEVPQFSQIIKERVDPNRLLPNQIFKTRDGVEYRMGEKGNWIRITPKRGKRRKGKLRKPVLDTDHDQSDPINDSTDNQ